MKIRHPRLETKEYRDSCITKQDKRDKATYKRKVQQEFLYSFFPSSSSKLLKAKYDEMEVNGFFLVRKYNISRNDYWIEILTHKDLLTQKRQFNTKVV